MAWHIKKSLEERRSGKLLAVLSTTSTKSLEMCTSYAHNSSHLSKLHCTFFSIFSSNTVAQHNRLNEVRYCTSFHCIAVCSGWGLWISKEQCLFWETAVILVCTFHQYKLETRVLWLSGVFVLGIKSGFSRRQSQVFLWITDCWHNELYSAILYVLTRYIKCKKRFFFPTIPPSISFRFSSLGSQGCLSLFHLPKIRGFFFHFKSCCLF